jgi:D-alanyl-D-alanine carboxypeptidase/D-alanyl-D-alanine-endopeptidase (penicillin-binding protein 4)
MIFRSASRARRKARVAHLRASSLRAILALLLLAFATGDAESAGRVQPVVAAAASLPASVGDALLIDPEEDARAKPASRATTKAAAPEPQRRSRRRPARRTTTRAPARPVVRATEPRTADALTTDLGTMIGLATRSGRWGAMVVSLTRGDTLYSLNADESLVPASTHKLYTAALALDRLGPDHRFSTDILRSGAVGTDGTLEGSLVIRGDGDPSLSSRWHRGTPSAPMDALARQVVAAGIKRVKGDIIGDASAFEAQTVPEGWLTRYLGAGYAARVSALSLNENVVSIVAAPGKGKGAAVVVFEPATTTLKLVNKTRTVPGSRSARISAVRRADGVVEARGWIGSRSAARGYLLVVDDPALFTTGAFRAALEKQGVVVEGQTRVGATPDSAEKIAALVSPPVSHLVSVMNRESINHYAELLFRNAVRGKAREGTGTAAAGNELLAKYLEANAGVPSGTVHASDGSGLSTQDRTSPRAMIKLLAHGHDAPWRSQFHASLPVAGESETLRHRMRYTSAAGNLHAKTGTTNEVIGLAGYVTAANGEVLAFTFLYNGSDRWNARGMMDTMGATMAAFVRP